MTVQHHGQHLFSSTFSVGRTALEIKQTIVLVINRIIYKTEMCLAGIYSRLFWIPALAHKHRPIWKPGEHFIWRWIRVTWSCHKYYMTHMITPLHPDKINPNSTTLLNKSHIVGLVDFRMMTASCLSPPKLVPIAQELGSRNLVYQGRLSTESFQTAVFAKTEMRCCMSVSN